MFAGSQLKMLQWCIIMSLIPNQGGLGCSISNVFIPLVKTAIVTFWKIKEKFLNQVEAK